VSANSTLLLHSGELYRVDERKLAVLDALECVPDHYIRRGELITHNDLIKEAFLYILPEFKPELLQRPHLTHWTTKDASIPAFVTRDQRRPGWTLDFSHVRR